MNSDCSHLTTLPAAISTPGIRHSEDLLKVTRVVHSTNRSGSGIICDVPDRGLNQKDFRRESDEQKDTYDYCRNCGGRSGACNRV